MLEQYAKRTAIITNKIIILSIRLRPVRRGLGVQKTCPSTPPCTSRPKRIFTTMIISIRIIRPSIISFSLIFLDEFSTIPYVDYKQQQYSGFKTIIIQSVSSIHKHYFIHGFFNIFPAPHTPTS